MPDPIPTRSSVGKAIARGAVWTVLIRVTNRSIGVVSTLVLARMLTPSDFGIYGLAMSVYALVELISAFGFGTALIQNQEATDEHYHTAWTLNFIFSLICVLVLYVSAPYAAEFLREPQLEIVLKFTCLLFLVDAFKNIGIINFQKNMTFDKEFKFRVLVKLTGFFVTVTLAIALRSYWAMLWGILASSLMLVAMSYLMQPFRPRFSLSQWREMIGFSSWLQVNNILNYFTRNTEKFMLSRTSGVTAVGSLTMAKETGGLLQQIAAPVHRAAFPGYAKVNRNPERLCSVFCDVMGILALSGFAVAIGIFAVAHILVPTLLGPKWVHIVPFVELLALASLILIPIRASNDLLISIGRVRWATGIIAVRLVILVSLLVYLLPGYGVMGVIYATLISYSLTVMLSYYILRVSISLGVMRVIRILYRPATAALVMWLVVSYLFPVYWAEKDFVLRLAQLFLAILTGGSCYVLMILILWAIQSRPEGPELHILRLLNRRTGLFTFLIPPRDPPNA